MIWEPFVLALFLGLVVSAGLYFAYLWPSIEPGEAIEGSEALEEPATAAADSSAPKESEPAPPAAPDSDSDSSPSAST